MSFEVQGWFFGEDECDPPEPDKRWLQITDPDGEEYAVVVQRKVNGKFDDKFGEDCVSRADTIVSALNSIG